MPPGYDPAALTQFHTNHLHSVILPFWLARSIDREYGGYFTCFDNRGARLLSEDKFTWSQGRMVWVFARLAQMALPGPAEAEETLALSAAGATFLMDHCLLDNGHCTFLMARDGTPKEQVPGQGYDTSVYADCFVILGLARYAAASGDRDALSMARRLYDSVTGRLESGAFRTEPYPTPKGSKIHGIPMIMLNVSQELSGAMRHLGVPEAADVDRRADGYMNEVMEHFLWDDVVHEMIGTDNQLVPGSLFGRYVNPGHTLEDMWFVMHQARARGNQDVIERAARVIRKTMRIGWDAEYGGILSFADQDGGMPRGDTAGFEEETMVRKVLGDWGNKLWWPHSEALYATLLAFVLTGDEHLFELYRQVHEYTFRVFPNPDQGIGEWIQIRDREGAPESKVVALPVKDPFHITRNLILIIDLLRGPGPNEREQTLDESKER